MINPAAVLLAAALAAGAQSQSQTQDQRNAALLKGDLKTFQLDIRFIPPARQKAGEYPSLTLRVTGARDKRAPYWPAAQIDAAAAGKIIDHLVATGWLSRSKMTASPVRDMLPTPDPPGRLDVSANAAVQCAGLLATAATAGAVPTQRRSRHHHRRHPCQAGRQAAHLEDRRPDWLGSYENRSAIHRPEPAAPIPQRDHVQGLCASPAGLARTGKGLMQLGRRSD